MGDITQMFKVAGWVLGGVAILFTVGVAAFFIVKRQGALRGE